MEKEKELRIQFKNQETLLAVAGHGDGNLKYIANKAGIKLIPRGNEITLQGEEHDLAKANFVLTHLLTLADSQVEIDKQTINYAFGVYGQEKSGLTEKLADVVYTTPRGKKIKARTAGQIAYLQAIEKNDVVFGIGPAGTGKTYLAVVMAVLALKRQEVGRIVLVRPAVEAGEKLGFLPGDLQDKVDPYLRPIYDSLYDVIGMDKADKFMERGIIEVAPLAYMRGRTLDDAFIILDEAQNTTQPQMKMFLTRLGFGSKAVVTGDVTQTDLPKEELSGLQQAAKILNHVNNLEFCYLTQEDVVRHPMVQKIIDAYAKVE